MPDRRRSAKAQCKKDLNEFRGGDSRNHGALKLCDQSPTKCQIAVGQNMNRKKVAWLHLMILASLTQVCAFSSYSRIPLSTIGINDDSRTQLSRAAMANGERQPIDEDKDKSPNQLDQELQYERRLPVKNDYRCGFVSLLGAANMGKSTLLNALLQEDLCVATRRPQTTRHAILGVVTTTNCQLCLIDTPGIIENPAYKLQEGMMEAVTGAFHDSDILLVVTDLFSTPIPDDEMFDRVRQSNKPIIVAINKIDLETKANPNAEENMIEGRTTTVAEAVGKWRELIPQSLAIVPLIASDGPTNQGVIMLRKLLLGDEDLPEAIRNLGRPIPGMFQPGIKFLYGQECRSLLPRSPPLYDEESLTDRSERFFASELIRGSLFESLKKELPYCCEVRILEFREPRLEDTKQVVRIKAEIIVERDSQKVIVIGKGGSQIKMVGSLARKKLEDFLQSKVFLDLSVKVNKDWRKNEDQLREYGYFKK